MGIETAIVGSALIGAAGSYASAKQASKGSKSTTEPWSGQQPYLLDSFSRAKDAVDGALAQGTYSGQRVADLNPYQTSSANFIADFANRYGAPAAQALVSTGGNFLGYGSQFGSNASDIFTKSSQDPTSAILSAASQYANNPYVDGLIDSTNRDVQRDLNENQLPSLARMASGSGNTNSTRAGVESAILQRGAADRMADTASKIRSQFFGQGLGMAQDQYNQNLQNMLQSNNQLLQAFQQGGNTILQGQQAAGNVFDQSQAAGGLFRGYDQSVLDANQQAFAESRDIPLDLIGRYQSIIGGNYGGTTTSSGPATSPWASALQGGLGAGLSAFGTFGRLGGFNTTPVTTAPSGGYTTNLSYSLPTSGVRFGST